MNKRIVSFLGLAVLLLLMIHEPVSAQRRVKKEKPKVVKVVSVYDLDTLKELIPRNRQIFHDRIDKEQRRADASDGAVDGVIFYSEDTALTDVLSSAILKDVDHIEVMIENMPANGRDGATDNQTKIHYLTAVWQTLQNYNANVKLDPYYSKKLITNLHDMLIAVNENTVMDFVKKNVSDITLENGRYLLDNNKDVRAYIYTEMGKRDPKAMIRRLGEYANDPFADDIIKAASRLAPALVFNYASSTNMPLRNAVRRSTDPLVQTIVRIADQSKSPLKALPFLGDIYNNKLTIPQIDAIADTPDVYYRNLVRIKLENDTLGRDTYTEELAYRGLAYVREMDDLHEAKDPIRFKCVDKMSPEALYFITVYGQDEIYTSSFLGTFKRIMERMKPAKGDSLLANVHYEHFRTFIRMCAGYNTLSTFLETIDPDKRTELMTSFIANLQKGKEDDLEDAVDVADAFGSIKDSALTAFLQSKVKENYELSYKERSKKGMVIYSLMAMLFEGTKSANSDAGAVSESEKLGLPPINVVPNKNLVDDSGTVYEQFFFFGDEDGKVSYASFLGNFKDGKWKITTDKYWSVISSTQGKKVVIYANLPIPEPDDEDAQNRLCKYMDSMGIHPTILVHRGHSYHLPTTLNRLTKQTKIVVLGSCGGYHNLAIVLDRAPDAHIISSKQTGTMSVNEPIIKAINSQLVEGNDINWIKIWADLETYFANKGEVHEKFTDYVPPYKNLGAIFIKAYRKMMNIEEEE